MTINTKKFVFLRNIFFTVAIVNLSTSAYSSSDTISLFNSDGSWNLENTNKLIANLEIKISFSKFETELNQLDKKIDELERELEAFPKEGYTIPFPFNELENALEYNLKETVPYDYDLEAWEWNDIEVDDSIEETKYMSTENLLSEEKNYFIETEVIAKNYSSLGSQVANCLEKNNETQISIFSNDKDERSEELSISTSEEIQKSTTPTDQKLLSSTYSDEENTEQPITSLPSNQELQQNIENTMQLTYQTQEPQEESIITQTCDINIPPSKEIILDSKPYIIEVKNNILTMEETSRVVEENTYKHTPHHHTLYTVDKTILANRFSTDFNTIVVNSNKAPIAAGDEEMKILRGLWLRGLHGVSNQGLINNIPGYKGVSRGGSIGFDIEKENNIIGFAYSQLYSTFKFKTNKNIDKELVKSHIFSLYGQKDLLKNFNIQAVMSTARNHVKNITNHLVNNTNYKTTAKYRNTSYNLESLLNYNYLTEYDITLIPNAGIRYGASHDGIYNENGVNIQDVLVTTKPHNILTGIMGAKFSALIRNINQVAIANLNLHLNVERNFNEKAQRTRRTIKNLDNLEHNYLMPKQPKIAYNLGGSITANVKNVQISLDYNCHLRKVYQSHQGSIKLKVNF